MFYWQHLLKSWPQRHALVILVLGRQRQADPSISWPASLDYFVSAKKMRDPVSKTEGDSAKTLYAMLTSGLHSLALPARIYRLELRMCKTLSLSLDEKWQSQIKSPADDLRGGPCAKPWVPFYLCCHIKTPGSIDSMT